MDHQRCSRPPHRWRRPNKSQQVSLPMCHSPLVAKSLQSTSEPEEGTALLSNEVRIQKSIAVTAAQ
uniref:Uncharacterized protein n=1 Tax=Daphnia galeata TaxID=27404 RepID=A0A8J2WQS5_9CRUS|nr:unnamed protein product [Daphnia galeata]